jgi:hypothetical protein
MIEMTNFFNILKRHSDNSIKTLHIAEGPGGFIEAVNYYRAHNCKKHIYTGDEYRGMTLIDELNNKIPGWNKAKQFIQNNKNVVIDYGATNDGDLYKLKNLDYIFKEHNGKYDIVTGDGGFDFSCDFNNQELMATKLIICEVLYGIICTKMDGTFIVKSFDMFTHCSYEIIFLLSSLFKEVYICKPDTSRYGNSEKYIICNEKLIDITPDIYNKLKKLFIQLHIFDGDFTNLSISSYDVPLYLKNEMNEMNCIFTERQLQNINDTLILMTNNKKLDSIKNIKLKNIKLCIEWLKNMCIPYNEFKKQNLFINK